MTLDVVVVSKESVSCVLFMGVELFKRGTRFLW